MCKLGSTPLRVASAWLPRVRHAGRTAGATGATPLRDGDNTTVSGWRAGRDCGWHGRQFCPHAEWLPRAHFVATPAECRRHDHFGVKHVEAAQLDYPQLKVGQGSRGCPPRSPLFGRRAAPEGEVA